MKKFEYSFEDVPCIDIADLSGWYYWYIDWNSVFAKRNMTPIEMRSCIENIIKFYDDKNFSCGIKNVESEFGERYTGFVKSDWKKKFKSENDNINTICNSWESFIIWIDLITDFKTPIYFGESENLYSRMKQHVEVLADQNYTGKENFGKRFNSRRRDFSLDKYLKPSNLKVKIFASESSDILEIERLINVIIKPINGVK
jgi:hypothetical protein